MALMLLVAMQIFSVISSDVATVYAAEVTDNEETVTEASSEQNIDEEIEAPDSSDNSEDISQENSEEISNDIPEDEPSEEQADVEEVEETAPATEDEEEIKEDEETVEVEDFAKEHTAEELELLGEEIDAEQKLLAAAGNASTVKASGAVTSTINYRYDSGTSTLYLTGKGAMPDLKPDSNKLPDFVSAINGKSVNIVIDEGITSIGKYNFIFPSYIKSIKLPGTLTKIGDYAFFFERFSKNQELCIPASVKTIGVKAFYGCGNLKAVVFKGNMPTFGANAFGCVNAVAYYPTDNKTYTKSKMDAASKQFDYVEWRTAETVGKSGKCGSVNWSYDEKSKTLTISGNGPMGDYTNTNKAPWYDMALTNVIINPGVTRIGNYAFNNMEIVNIRIPNTIKQVGDYAFLNAECGYGSTEVAFPLINSSSFTEIGEGAFQNARFYATTATVLDLSNATVISERAFYKCYVGRKENTATFPLKLSNNLRRIEDQAFEEATFIKGQLILPSNITYIGDRAFYDDEGITGTLTLPDTLMEVNCNSFAEMGISTVNVGNGVKNIMASAFYDNRNLQEITIGKNVEFIGTRAFEINNSNVVKCNFYCKAPRYGHYAFSKINALIYSEDASWDKYEVDDFACAYQGSTIEFKTKLVPITLKYFNDKYKPCTTQTVINVRKNSVYQKKNLPTSVNINGQDRKIKSWYRDGALKLEFPSYMTVSGPMELYAHYTEDKVTPEHTVDPLIMAKMGFESNADVPKGIWVYCDETVEYTGKPIKPCLRVFYYTLELSEGKDYTVTYSKNINAGKASYTIQGKGSYAGKKTGEFEILPINIATSKYFVEYQDNTLTTVELAYNGKVQKPKITVRKAGYTKKEYLAENKDYTVKYIGTDKTDANTYNKDAFKAVGKYKVEIIGKGNYKGSLVCHVKIENKIDISKCKITLPKLSGNYDSKISSLDKPFVEYQGKSLLMDKDWSYTYLMDSDAGYITYTFNGISAGRCVGTVDKKAKIKGKNISTVYVELDTDKDPADVQYSYRDILKVYTDKGAALKKDSSKLLRYGFDYKVEVLETKGKFKVKLRAGDYPTVGCRYIGHKVVEFKSKKYKDISNCSIKAMPITVTEVKLGNPILDVRLNGNKLTPNVDYRYNLSQSISKPSNGAVVYFDAEVEGIGNYCGKKTFSGKVTKISLASAKVVKSASEINIKKGLVIIYKEKVFKPEGIINPEFEIRYYYTDASSGKTNYQVLNKRDDYYLHIPTSRKPGKAQLTIEGCNAWTGKKTLTYMIDKYATSDVSNSGCGVLEKKMGVNIPTDLNLLHNGTILKPGVDYTIEKTIYRDSEAKIPVKQTEVVKAGTQLYAAINFKGNYQPDRRIIRFTVVKNTIKSGKATIADRVYDYDTSKNRPRVEDVTLVVNGKTLPKDSYYILNYSDIGKAGTVTVIIQGIPSKGYVGRIKATYKLTQKKFVVEGRQKL